MAIKTDVNFDYKNNALKNTYDIEALADVFTIAWISDHALSFMLFGNEQFDDVSDDFLLDKMYDFASQPENMKDLGVSSPDDLDYYLYRYEMGNAEDMKQFSQDLKTIGTCKPVREDVTYANTQRFVEYYGWNTGAYDLLMIIAARLYADYYKYKLRPKHLREVSNAIIEFNGPPWKMGEHLQEQTNGVIKAGAFKINHHLALYEDGHVDWAKISQSSEDSDGTSNMMVPGLKKEMAKFGKDVIIDDVVKDDEERQWSEKEKKDFIDYNFNDVLGTRFVGGLSQPQNELKTRDTLRKMFPYTSAKSRDMSSIRDYAPPERDITAANLASEILIGPNRKRPQDTEVINYMFPVPDPENPGQEKKVDLWAYIKEKEPFVHDYMDIFFTHFRGKDTRNYADNERAKNTQPITKKGQINIPYYRNGKPTDAVIRISTGGAHGFVFAKLNKMNEEEINKWIISDAHPKDHEKPTIDSTTIIHADYRSYYPNIAKKIGLYLTTEGVDRMGKMIDFRMNFKADRDRIAESLGMGTEEYRLADEKQNSLKLGLNSPTGKGNTHKPYALLPVDNKTMSMRLIGNMLIWCLAQRLTDAGAYVVSTNTDGIYVDNITKEKAQEVMTEYYNDYGMSVDPEPLVRFVNRNTSERIEYHKDADTPDVISGDLKHGKTLEYQPSAIGKNINFPLIAANAVLHYISSKKDWLTTTYDRSVIADYIQSVWEDEWNPQAWYVVYSGTSARHFTLDGALQQKIVRLFLTKNGGEIGNKRTAFLKSDETIHVWNTLMDGYSGSIKHLTLNDSDESADWVDADGFLSRTPIEDIDFAFIYKNKSNGLKNEFWDKADVPELKVDADAPGRMSTNGNGYMGREMIKKLRIGYFHPTRREWMPLQHWKPGAVTGYPTPDTKEDGTEPPLKGTVVNLARELHTFDKHDLDLDMYIRWAEQILELWKVTGDIEDVGMQHMGPIDTVVKKKGVRKLNKKDRQMLSVFNNVYRLNVTEDEILNM